MATQRDISIKRKSARDYEPEFYDWLEVRTSGLDLVEIGYSFLEGEGLDRVYLLSNERGRACFNASHGSQMYTYVFTLEPYTPPTVGRKEPT